MNISVVEKFKNDGQGTLEYIILLAVCSALLVFGSPYVMRIIDGFDNGFAYAVDRMLHPKAP